MSTRQIIAVSVVLFLNFGIHFSLFAEDDKPVYVDARALTIIGQVVTDSEKPYQRANPEKIGLSESISAKCRQATGIAVVFKTDTRNLYLRWTTSSLKNLGVNSGALLQKGLDIYIKKDGEWRYAASAAPEMKGECKNHYKKVLGSMPMGEKEVLIFLPPFDSVHSLLIGTDPKAKIEATTNPFKKRIVFHGSSITHGASASRPGMTYVSRYQRESGLQCFNLGFSGQAKLQIEFAQYLSTLEADAFVFDVFSNPNAKEIKTRFNAFVKEIRKNHKNTPLVFVQTIRREARNFNEAVEKHEAEKQSAAEQVVKEAMKSDKNIYFIDSDGFLGEDSMATVDGTHPNDLGFTRMLEKLIPALNKIFRQHGILTE